MAVYLSEQNILVTAAPGTGSTSLESWALSVPGARAPSLDLADAGYPKHLTLADLTAAGWTPAHRDRPVVLTSTRNPFDFWAAEWHRTRTRWLAELPDPHSWVHRVPGMVERIVHAVQTPFDEWVQECLAAALENGACRHLNPGHVEEADVVVRMEHLDTDLQASLGDLGHGVPHLNSTSRATCYWQLYGAGGRRAVAAVHEADLQRFGYAF